MLPAYYYNSGKLLSSDTRRAVLSTKWEAVVFSAIRVVPVVIFSRVLFSPGPWTFVVREVVDFCSPVAHIRVVCGR